MRVAIDMQTTLGQPTGIGFYVSNLVHSIERIDRKNEYIKLLPQKQEDFRSVERFLWDQITVPGRARQAKADLLHQPGFSAPVMFGKPVVVTIHDLIAIRFGKDIPTGSRLYFGKWMPFSYRYADHIIAVSEHTKRDIMELLGVPNEKITVIYEAMDEAFQPIRDKRAIERVKQKYNTGDHFILHVGTINPRKNLEFLVKVFAQVQKKVRTGWKLVITGKKGWYYEGLFKAVKDLGLESSVVFTGYIPEADKAPLYNAASIAVTPSIYEGAGLPPVEAMACGTPVVSSNTSSLPEMVGDGGMLLPPTDTDGWVKSLVHLMRDPALRRDWGARGRKYVKRFTWERTARETIKVYERVYEQSKQ